MARWIDHANCVIYDALMAARCAPSRANGRAQRQAAVQSLCRISKEFYQRGWALGTSGNFSAVVSRNPLQLAVTQSGVDKGSVTPTQIVLVNDAGEAINARARPSAEVLLHLTIAQARRAGAVLHTHSIWSTIASEMYADEDGVRIKGYEMLKGLEGVHTHQHSEWLPIIDNSQDIRALARELGSVLARRPDSHGILLRRHGLYTWGKDLAQAKRHVEILEFLLEITSILDCMRTHSKFIVQSRAGSRKSKN
ncbi:MAG TPA: methylthioribulose 1-phosphate dehydratase [Terriglobia bacterium]|nr:methylthioribulose 1-phosphate dehydratase [Terriglobia bacterium]